MSLKIIDLEICGQACQQAGSIHNIESIDEDIEPEVASVLCGSDQELAARQELEIDDLILGGQNSAFFDSWKISSPRSVKSTSACDKKLDLIVGGLLCELEGWAELGHGDL